MAAAEDFYFQLFIEGAHEASIVPLGNDTTFYVMHAFGTFDMTAPFVLTIIATILGHIFNWYVGRSLLYFEHKGHWRVGPERYERARKIFDRYVVWLLLLCWAPLMNLLTVAAGFLNLPRKRILPFIIVGLVWHYGSALIG